MSKVIRAICDNGYDGVLIPNHSMTIRFKGERVFATYSPAPKNYNELMDVLETMPQSMVITAMWKAIDLQEVRTIKNGREWGE